MKKSYRIKELNKFSISNRTFIMMEDSDIFKYDSFDSFEEAEKAIEEHGDCYQDYTIISEYFKTINS